MNDKREPSFEEELLDRALEHHRAEEPRPGLEQRVLARLDSAPAPRFGWHWKAGVVMATAALFAAVALYLTYSPSSMDPSPKQPQMARSELIHVPAPEGAPSVPEFTVSLPPALPRAQENTSDDAQAVNVETVLETVVETASSRSPTFPSTRELSPQEALLVRFVQRAPEQTLRSIARTRPTRPLHVEKLSMQRLTVEPLRVFDPISKS